MEACPRALDDLAAVGTEIAMGFPPPSNLNDHLMAFLPKGSEEADLAEGATREAASTRPLALKNTDAKLLATGVNDKIKGILALHSPKSQRGFLPGR